MKYKGTELKEFTSDKPVVFDPPKKMLVWDDVADSPEDVNVFEANVYAFMPAWRYRVATATQTFVHCAEIPEEPKPRRATNLELAKWLSQGNGEKTLTENDTDMSVTRWNTAHYEYESEEADEEVPDIFVVRKWDDKEWHEPTADYMGLEDCV